MEERGYVSLRYRSSHERTEEAQLDSIDPSTCLEFLSPREQRAEEAKRRRQGLFWRIERHVSTRLTGKIGSKRLIKILRFFLFHFQPPTTNDFLKIGEILINPWKNGKSIQIIHEERTTFVSRRQRRVGQSCINDYTFPSTLRDVTDKRSLRVSKILTNILHYSWRPSPPPRDTKVSVSSLVCLRIEKIDFEIVHFQTSCYFNSARFRNSFPANFVEHIFSVIPYPLLTLREIMY